MIGFNEYAEAYHLYRLLGISRTMLDAFNLTNEELCAQCDRLPDAPAKPVPRRNWWYQRLLYTTRCLEASGLFSFDFSGSDCKRHTYELLSRLPLQPEETEEAPVPDELLGNLSPERRQTVRRLYARLLRVEPMRQMFACLHDYTKKAVPAKRPVIPDAAEYGQAKAPTLNLIDNGFSILSILIQQGEALFEDQLSRTNVLYVPLALLKQGHSPQSILAATLIHRNAPDAMEQFCPIPGGHTQLGLYGDATPESLFRNVLNDQQRHPKPLLENRSYHDFRLVKLTGDPGVETKQSSFVLPSDSMLDILEERWQKTAAMTMEQLKASPEEPPLPNPSVENGFLRICDNGGQLAFRLLEAAHKQLRSDLKKDSDTLLRDLLRSHYLFPDQLEIALTALHQYIKTGLEADPQKGCKGKAEQVRNINANASLRLTRLIVWWYLKQQPKTTQVKLSTIMSYLRKNLATFQQDHDSLKGQPALLPPCQWSPQQKDWLLTVGDK